MIYSKERPRLGYLVYEPHVGVFILVPHDLKLLVPHAPHGVSVLLYGQREPMVNRVPTLQLTYVSIYNTLEGN